MFDDLWSIAHWEGLKSAFHHRGTKTKIVLTTRNKEVAEIGFTFKPLLLNVDDGLELLKKKAFPRGTATGSGYFHLMLN